MSVVTFLGSGREQVGKTLAIAGIATNMSIQHNKKILIISASYSNNTLKNCYWSNQDIKRTGIFKPKNGVEVDSGMVGLAKIVLSNKINPETITDYTRVIFKDRLEVLLGFDEKDLYTSEETAKIYSNIINAANKYYDIVFVDLDNELEEENINEILQISDVLVAMTAQKVSDINIMLEKTQNFDRRVTLFLIGRYDDKSKYTLKNLSRTIGPKYNMLAIPYNTLYFEATQEGNVPDLFLRLRRIQDKNDENSFFIESVKKVTDAITTKIEEAQMIK